MRKGIFEAIMTSIGWFADHTDKAKELSIQNINKATEIYNSGNPSWSRWLGWAFHFITDGVTPYHSSIARSKYILDSKKDLFNKKTKNGGVSFWTTIANRFLNFIMFKADYDKFEDICEERWQRNQFIIKDDFIKFKKKNISFVDLEIFSERMVELQANCENRLLDWITICSDFLPLCKVDPSKLSTTCPIEPDNKCRNFDFHIALTFSGEDRNLVENISKSLKERGVKTFYDKDYQTKLWGKRLTKEFEEIYSKKSRY